MGSVEALQASLTCYHFTRSGHRVAARSDPNTSFERITTARISQLQVCVSP